MKRVIYLLIAIGFSFISFNASAGDNWKIRLDNGANNLWAETIKIQWYCNGKKKDTDTVAYLTKKTRALGYSKCRKGNELTVKFKVGNTLYFPIIYGAGFVNNFVGSKEFMYSQRKHCFAVSNQVLSGQPTIKPVSC